MNRFFETIGGRCTLDAITIGAFVGVVWWAVLAVTS